MEQKNNNFLVGMTAFGAIFFIFGFATTFIIQLSAPVMAVFNLTEFQAQLLTSAFFISYPILSAPTYWFVLHGRAKSIKEAGILCVSAPLLLCTSACRYRLRPFVLSARWS